MNKLTPKNKICFQNNGNIRINLKLKNLKSKKWNIYKKKIKYKKEIKPEQRKKFFQKRLVEFQLFKNYYGSISNSKIKKLFKQLNKKEKKKNVFKTFILTLERRLDIFLIRFKFTNSIYKAKQLINHKKVKINNKVINKPNYQLKIGDIISIIKKKNAKI
jgi:small subunit ribosomal protein S4